MSVPGVAQPWRCPAYRQPMQVLELEGRKVANIEVDHCSACRLVWFEPLEVDAIAQPGWVELLWSLVEPAPAAPGDGSAPAEARRCPRCQAGLRAEPQATSFGRHVAHVCPHGHGQAQRDGALLASRGLFRPLLLAERVALATERRQLHCLPCGAALDGSAEHCAYCGSPATVVDMPRLRRALGLAGGQRTAADAPLLPWACHGCGTPLDATQQTACPQCRHPVLAPALSDLKPLLASARRPTNPRGGARAGFVAAKLQQLGWGFWPVWFVLMGCAALLAAAGWLTRP